MAKKNVNTGTNLDKLKQVFNASGPDSSFNWFRPNWDDNLIRILPPISSDDVFYHETARHNIDGANYYCLAYDLDEETGRPRRCPICEARKKLYRTNDTSMISLAKKIKAKKQFLMNVVDRADNNSVKVYGAGVKLTKRIITGMIDDEIDITDVEEGYDVNVKKEQGPPGPDGVSYPNYDNSTIKRKPSPVADDEKEVANILESRIDLSSIPHFDTEEVLKEAVEAYIASATDTSFGDSNFFDGADSSKEDSDPTPKKATTTKSKPKSNNVSDFRKQLEAQLKGDPDEDE